MVRSINRPSRNVAVLEKLVHAVSLLPPNQSYLRTTVPNGTSYEIFQTATHPCWDGKDESLCKAFRTEWL